MDTIGIGDQLQSILEQSRLRGEAIRSRMAWIEIRRRELWERMDEPVAERDGGGPPPLVRAERHPVAVAPPLE